MVSYEKGILIQVRCLWVISWHYGTGLIPVSCGSKEIHKYGIGTFLDFIHRAYGGPFGLVFSCLYPLGLWGPSWVVIATLILA